MELSSLVKWLADERESKKSNVNKTDDAGSTDLKMRKIEEEIKILESRNRILEGKYVDAQELRRWWEAIGTTLGQRLEALARNLGGEDAVQKVADLLDKAEKDVIKSLEVTG